jgi:hypothetical protein
MAIKYQRANHIQLLSSRSFAADLGDFIYNSKVLTASFHDLELKLTGEKWHLTAICPWEISFGKVKYGWLSDEASSLMESITGSIITNYFASDAPTDFSLIFDNRTELMIKPDKDFDPWWMIINGNPWNGKNDEYKII